MEDEIFEIDEELTQRIAKKGVKNIRRSII